MKKEETKYIKEIGLFFIKILLDVTIYSVVIYFVNSPLFYNFLIKTVPDIKLFGGYLRDIVKELIAFIVVLTIIYFTKIHKPQKKKEKTFKSILKAWPMFLCLLPELLFLLYEIIFINNGLNYYAAFGLICYCFTIGLTEEFFSRKLVQNAFVEKFGDSYRGVVLSIVLGAILFGLLHAVNFFLGQSLYNTIWQIVQSISWAMVIGIIYYKTKNIWSVVLIHTLEDFILKLDEIVPLSNYAFNYNPASVQVLKFFLLIISISIYTIYSIQLFQSFKNNKADKIKYNDDQNDILINKQNTNKKYTIVIISLLCIYIFFEMLFISLHIK